MRKWIIMAMIVGICAPVFGTVPLNEINFSNVNSGRFDRNLRGWFSTVNGDIMQAGVATGTGVIYWVDSGASNAATASGLTPETALPTVNAALSTNHAQADRGDYIYVIPGHAENGSDADLVDVDVAGVTIIHLGNGTNQGSYEFDDTDTTWVIGAANVTIVGGRFVAGVNLVVVGIDIENAGDYATLIGCQFPDGAVAGTDEFIDTIKVGTTATNVAIHSCKYFSTGTNSNNFIDLSAATIANPTVINNTIYGAFAEAGIWAGAAVPTNCMVSWNTVTNTTSGQLGIEFSGNATGWMIDNMVSTDAIGTSYDPGRLSEGGTNWWDDFDTYDTSSVPWTTNETGVNRWGATELAQIEGEVDDGVTANASIVAMAADTTILTAGLLSADATNYLAVATGVFDTTGTWSTQTAHEIAAVTGAVRMQIMIEVVASVESVNADGTIALGAAGNTAFILAATDIEGGAGALVTGDIVSAVFGGSITGLAGTEAHAAATSAIFDIAIVQGLDVGYTVGTNALDAGSLIFHIWWTPLDATGSVSAGAGGAF